MRNIRILKTYYKTCDKPICKPLEIIFRSCSENGKFPSHGKKPMWFLSSTKATTSLLPVSSEIFERLLYDCMFKLFTKNSLISQN